MTLKSKFVLCFVFFLLPLTLWADNQMNPDKVIDFDKGWKAMDVQRLAKPGNSDPIKSIRFHVDADSLQLESNESVGFFYRKLLSGKELRSRQWQLSWRWRVLKSSSPVPTNTAQGDDRPLALHLWLNDPGSVGWFKGQLAKLFAIPTPGYMLTYSWGGTEPKGTSFTNPHVGDNQGLIRILRNHDAIGEKWLDESIIINEEIEKAFGNIRKKKLYVVVSADNEDSLGHSLAEVRDIRLTPLIK